MSSLRRKPNSRFWIACFTGPDGGQVQRSTKVPIDGATPRQMPRLLQDIASLLEAEVRPKMPTGTAARLNKRDARRLAELIAGRFEVLAIEARSGRLTEAQARRTIAEIYETSNREALPSSSVADFMRDWLDRKSVETGEKTRDRYAVAIDSFLDHLGDRAQVDLAHLRSRDIADWRDAIAGKVTSSTVNFGIKVVRAALNSARRDGLVSENEATKVTILKTRPNDTRRPFSPAELRRVVDAADDEWRGMIMVGLYTGARLGDVAKLRWGDTDLLNKVVRFTARKTGRAMEIPLAPPLHRHLESLPTPDDPHAYLFPRAAECYERNYFNGLLSKQFRAILVKAGLAQARKNRETGTGHRGVKHKADELSYHCLRHTFVSWLKDAGATDSVARDLAGHESADVNRLYTHLAPATRRAAVAQLPDILV